ELTVPVKDAGIRAQILSILELGFMDNRKLWRLESGSHYTRVPRAAPAVFAQEALIRSPDPLLDKENPAV
ncbi:MAG: hypothetical protein GX623_00125, partial [Clostridiales bacterium]|nr:hypothetical protein [Clostridiales bacterium]